MSDIPRQILCTLIREQGVQVIQNASKFQNLLIDYTKGEFKKERKCLNDSLAEGIPDTLLTKKDQLSYHQLSQQLSQKLIDNLGVTPELAKWTVDSWALALGVIQDQDHFFNFNSSNTLSQNALSSEIQQVENYTFTITSNPTGAKLSLNGEPHGVTPLILKNPELKTYSVQISHEGYLPWVQVVDLLSKTDKRISANLEKNTRASESIVKIITRSFLRIIAFVLAIFLIIFGISLIVVYTIGGAWPPVVGIQGNSMAPNLNNGDLVIIVQNDRFGELQTWDDGKQNSYRRFGDYGDIIICHPNGEKDTEQYPLITRAMKWVKVGEPVPTYLNVYRGSVTPAEYLPISVSGQTADGYKILTVKGTAGVLPTYMITSRDVTMKTPLGNYVLPADTIVKNAGYVRDTDIISTHGGYITKGDNNYVSDQGYLTVGSSGTVEPVQKEWIIGKAIFSIPYLGFFSLNIGFIIFIIAIIILVEFFRNRWRP